MKALKMMSACRCALPVVLSFLMAWSWVGVGEGAQAQEAATAPVAAAAAQEAVDLSSPRATLLTFLDAMNAVRAGKEEAWSAALQSIYLLEVPEDQREQTGRELANELFEVLDAITLDMDRVPEEPGEKTVETALDDAGEVVLNFRLNDDGFWRFSYTLLTAKIDEMHSTVVEEADGEARPDAGVNPLLATPRRTVRTFIEGVERWEEGGFERAMVTLDLSEVDSRIREEVGETTLVLIKRVLDRDHYVIYQEIPNRSDGPPYVLVKDTSDPMARRKIEIVPVPIGDEGGPVNWQFSAATVAVIQELWDVYRDQPLLAGVEDSAPQIFSLRLRDWLGDHYAFLLTETFILENWQWLGLLTIILLGMAMSRLAGFLLIVVIRRLFQREDLRLDTKLEKGFVVPIRIAIMAWMWWIALRPLGLPPETLTVLKRAAAAVSAAALVWAIYRLVDILGKYLAEKAARTENKFDDLVVPLVVRSLKVFVVAFGLVFVADQVGLNFRAALAGVGLGGLAFALAAQDTISNIFGSMTILFDKPFQIGDWVVIDNIDGNVEQVGIRSTRIRTFYNSLVTVPNSKLTNAVVDNYGERRYRRLKTMIGIARETPPNTIEAFCEGIRELIRRHPYTRTDYYHVYLNEYAESCFNILLYCFHECPDWSTELRERHRLLLDIIRLANRLGVEFAYPTQTLHMHKDGAKLASNDESGDVEEALVLGRREAQALVEDVMGKDAPVPPPVSFQDAPPDSGYDREDGT